MLDGEVVKVSLGEPISPKLQRFCAELYVRLNQIDKEYNRWLMIHYPAYELVAGQQRLRTVGIAMALYTEVTGRELEEEDKRRIVDWVKDCDFTVVDEQRASEIFFRLHSNVPFRSAELCNARILCEPFSYDLVPYTAV